MSLENKIPPGGSATRNGKILNAYKIIVWNRRRNPHGRSHRIWEDNAKIDFREMVQDTNWIHLIQDGFPWEVLVKNCNENLFLLEYNDMYCVESQPTLRRNMSTPSSGSNINNLKFCTPPAFTLVSCLAYSSSLKMEATCSSETSVDSKLTTWRCIPEGRTLHDHNSENLKSFNCNEFSGFIIGREYLDYVRNY
jgi:hypothetical protein